MILSIIFISVSTIYIINNKDDIYLFDRGFNIEGFEASRGDTIFNFINEFGSEPNDYLIGRGLNGTFQSFPWAIIKFQDLLKLDTLNVLLKGGFIFNSNDVFIYHCFLQRIF